MSARRTAKSPRAKASKRDKKFKGIRWSRRTWLTAGAIFLGVGMAVGSYFLFTEAPWWSNILANASVVILLLIPGEWILSRLSQAIVDVDEKATQTDRTANQARAVADVALRSAETTAQSLQDVRQSLIERQHEELTAERGVYESLTADLHRENIIRVLRKATGSHLISTKGVRAPIWETDLHYRYIVGDDGTLTVTIERDDQTVLDTVVWPEGEGPADFFQRLVLALRGQGADLGTGLNDPTESLERLSEMLAKVVSLRSQELLGYREKLRQIVEFRDGWYFTELHLTSPNHHGYTIAVDRLNEIDWESHLYGKDWPDGVDAVQFARRLYGVEKDIASFVD